ncbi:DUF6361 family protein [Bradyrhizobium sp. CB3481]|uniref:DUF6361 family protein n=1 Tax=Bradyrhizobium sp. CB3481 TaxID=3039158 RepID=UPI0024B26341|nr:DUF6361 family protein [Bradyrhizobium sp. CB3481]WFU16453.1 DUF6361 family protein [Bradyrhizobium sp. CB3481]
MSSLAWIDFDEAERQRAERIMALFQEREGRDELGLGAIRDSIADHLFPGTSTIQTRLRYMLFIPWVFRMLEGRDVQENQLRVEARALEIRLADALRAGGESNGIIGRDAGPRLQRLPSSVYWAGLGAWGIRLFPGSIDSLLSSLRGLKRLRVSYDGEDASAVPRAAAIWSQALPQPPKDLLERAVFRLTGDEAQFIIDRLVATQPAALLTLLARDGINAECDHIWTHPHLASFPAHARRLVRHGEIFSHVMHGAALLYNLALSELRSRDDWAADYRERIASWAAGLDLSVVRSWSLDDFWNAVEHPGHSIRPAAKRFVMQWLELVIEGTTRIALSSAARQLVEERERRLKTSQSRYTNHAVRDRWTGASGVNRLNFRWSQAKSHLKDLANAE